MASIRTRAGRPKPYEAIYRDPDGRQRTKSFVRKTDARRFLTNVEADQLRGAYVDPDAGRVTFAAFAEEWLAAQTFDSQTRNNVESQLRAHLLPAFGELELRAIKPSTVQAWLGSASRELAPSTARLVLSTLSSMLGDAVEDGVIAVNPCRARSVKPPAPARDGVDPWTVERVQAIVAALPERYAATAVVGAGCGLRQGEVFGLRVCDVDFLGQQVRVRQQAKRVRGEGVVLAAPKGGRTRDVPLPDSVAQAVAEHLRAYPARADGDGLVFTGESGGPVSASSYNQRVWRPAVRAAGLEPSRDTGFHQLRHHYASVLLDNGVSIRALADYLGHIDPGFTLKVYTHLMPASEDRARAAVDGAHGEREPSVSQAGQG
jgi:integrase